MHAPACAILLSHCVSGTHTLPPPHTHSVHPYRTTSAMTVCWRRHAPSAWTGALCSAASTGRPLTCYPVATLLTSPALTAPQHRCTQSAGHARAPAAAAATGHHGPLLLRPRVLQVPTAVLAAAAAAASTGHQIMQAAVLPAPMQAAHRAALGTSRT